MQTEQKTNTKRTKDEPNKNRTSAKANMMNATDDHQHAEPKPDTNREQYELEINGSQIAVTEYTDRAYRSPTDT
ncbi:hypothetical protein AmFV_185 [Apis mellifera filamentous virus]|nr:hypothetical protein AmFV_185 [Apis mellifera filamentous virus]